MNVMQANWETRQAAVLAADLLADTESLRSMAYANATLKIPEEATEAERGAMKADTLRFRQALDELGPPELADIAARLVLLDRFPREPNVTLAHVINRGNWLATNEVERELKEAVPRLLAEFGYEAVIFDKETPEAKRRIYIRAGYIDDDTTVAVEIVRRFMVLKKAGGSDDDGIEIDKRSVFAMTVEPDAPPEIGEIIASVLYGGLNQAELHALNDMIANGRNGGDSLNAHVYGATILYPKDVVRLHRELGKINKMCQMFGLSVDDLHNGHELLTTPEAIAYVNDRRESHSEDMVPSMTSYYGHRAFATQNGS